MKAGQLNQRDFFTWGKDGISRYGDNLHVTLQIETRCMAILNLFTLEITDVGIGSTVGCDYDVFPVKMETTKWNFDVDKNNPIMLKNIKPRGLLVQDISPTDPTKAVLYMVRYRDSREMSVVNFKNFTHQEIKYSNARAGIKVYRAKLKHPIKFTSSNGNTITWSL